MENHVLDQVLVVDLATENQSHTQKIKQVIADAERFQNDPEQFTDLFTRNAVVINVQGKRFMGRDELYNFMKKATRTFLGELILKNEVINITFISPNVAVVSAVQHIIRRSGDFMGEEAKGSLTMVLVPEEDKWLIAVAQNTFIEG